MGDGDEALSMGFVESRHRRFADYIRMRDNHMTVDDFPVIDAGFSSSSVHAMAKHLRKRFISTGTRDGLRLPYMGYMDINFI